MLSVLDESQVVNESAACADIEIAGYPVRPNPRSTEAYAGVGPVTASTTARKLSGLLIHCKNMSYRSHGISVREIQKIPLDDCIGTISMVNEVPEIACVYGFGSSVPDEQLAKVHNKIANPNLLFIPT